MSRGQRLAIAAVLLTACYLRVAQLSNLPGINGDEAWYGVQVMALLQGQDHQFVNPHGRLESLPYLGTLIAIQALSGPSLAVLRLPSVISGLLLLPLCFYLVRRLTDGPTALVATLMLACLPVNIAYSRFGWPPSQLGLMAILALYLALERRWGWLATLFLVSIQAYPPFVFLAPIVLGPAAAEALLSPRWSRQAKLRGTLLLGVAALVALLGAMLISDGLFEYMRTRGIGHRLRNPGQAFWFTAYFGRLITGVTTYQYLVGQVSKSVLALHAIPFWALFAGLLVVGGRRAVRERDSLSLGLLGGIFCAATSVYLIGGLTALTPHYERYSIFLVVPVIVLFSRLIFGASGTPQWPVRRVWCATLLAGCMLLSFQQNYWQRIQRTGGESSMTFRTASVEPKQQVVQLIRADLRARQENSAVILAEDWWSYWVVRYLVSDQPQIRVYMLRNRLWQSKEVLPPEKLEETLRAGAYVVGYDNGFGGKLVRDQLPTARVRQWVVNDYSDRPVLRIWRLE